MCFVMGPNETNQQHKEQGENAVSDNNLSSMSSKQPSHQTTAETIPSIFVRYLKATSNEEKQSVVQAYLPLFPEPVITALDDARRQFNDTMCEVKEACRMIDAVSGGLEYTRAPVELQPSEAKALLDEDTILQNFASSLATLLAERERHGSLVLSTATNAVVGAGPEEPGSSAALVAATDEGGTRQRGAWFVQPALVLTVLSFLPAQVVFMEAENVCRSWQAWLYTPEVSRFFWVGCVQREFPQQLAALVQTEGEDLFQSDWRSIAMLCVTEAEGEGEEAEEGEVQTDL
jgi:hypothetical protein